MQQGAGSRNDLPFGWAAPDAETALSILGSARRRFGLVITTEDRILRLLPKPFHAANLLGAVSEALAEDRSGEVQ